MNNDDVEDSNPINPTFFTGLSSFLLQNGYKLELISSNSVIQSNDFVIIYQSTSNFKYKEIKQQTIHKIIEKLTRYNNLNCKVGILTDLQKKTDLELDLPDFKQKFHNNDVIILSLNEISEQMFHFIQQRILQFNDNEIIEENNNMLSESIEKLSHDLNNGMIQITKNYRNINDNKDDVIGSDDAQEITNINESDKKIDQGNENSNNHHNDISGGEGDGGENNVQNNDKID